MFFSNHNRSDTKEDARMHFTQMSWKYFHFKKANTTFYCRVCQTTCQKGMHYVGDGYAKTCMNCAPIYMDNTIKQFKEWLSYIEANIEISKINKTKWMKEALVGSIEQNNEVK